jgi:hypothetical protein
MKIISKSLMHQTAGGACKGTIMKVGKSFMIPGMFPCWIAPVFFISFNFCHFRLNE